MGGEFEWRCRNRTSSLGGKVLPAALVLAGVVVGMEALSMRIMSLLPELRFHRKAFSRLMRWYHTTSDVVAVEQRRMQVWYGTR